MRLEMRWHFRTTGLRCKFSTTPAVFMHGAKFLKLRLLLQRCVFFCSSARDGTAAGYGNQRRRSLCVAAMRRQKCCGKLFTS